MTTPADFSEKSATTDHCGSDATATEAPSGASSIGADRGASAGRRDSNRAAASGFSPAMYDYCLAPRYWESF